jgi:hypothetical protein
MKSHSPVTEVQLDTVANSESASFSPFRRSEGGCFLV